jgi:dihydrofolate reductase
VGIVAPTPNCPSSISIRFTKIPVSSSSSPIPSAAFRTMRDFDLLVYGRKTYQLMVPYWPDIAKSQSETRADIEFAQTFVSKKKIVFSRSLASAEDENTRIVRTNLRDEILKLKQEQGKKKWSAV